MLLVGGIEAIEPLEQQRAEARLGVGLLLRTDPVVHEVHYCAQHVAGMVGELVDAPVEVLCD